METPLKRCTQCGNEYPATTEYFHSDSSRFDGLHCYCKPCRKARARSHFLNNRDAILERNARAAWKENNPSKAKATRDQWQAANRERTNAQARDNSKKHQAKRTVYVREWRAKNAEHYRAYERQYRDRNRERVLDNARHARQRDPLRYRAYILNRRAQELIGPGVTKGDIIAQHERQQGQCYWCSASVADSYHVDHFIPLNRQGLHSPDNIVIACPACNTSKGDKLPYTEWTPPNPL